MIISRLPACATMLDLCLYAGAAEPLTDSLGDPLPPGAVARIGTVRLRTNGVACLAFSPDGQRLASCGRDIRIWDVATGKLRHTCGNEHSRSRNLAFSPDGRLLASGDWQGAVVLWDVATGKEVKRLADQIGAGADVQSLSFAADGKYLASTDRLGEVNCWDTATGARVNHFKVEANFRCPVTLSADGKLAASVKQQYFVQIWDVFSGKQLLELPRQADDVLGVSFSPDSRYLIVGVLGGRSDELILWELSTGKEALDLPCSNQHQFAFSPDGRTLLSSGDDDTIRFWDLSTGKHRKSIQVQGGVGHMAISADGARLAAATREGVIHVCELKPGLILKDDSPIPLGFVDGGKKLAVASHTSLTYYDLKRPKRDGMAWTPREVRCVAMGVKPFALSSDGKLAAAGEGAGASLWNVAEGTELRKAKQDLRRIAFAPDGKTYVTCDAGQPVAWDVTTGKQVRNFEGAPAARHGAVALSPDGKVLAAAVSGTGGIQLRLYEFDTGKELLNLSDVIGSETRDPPLYFLLAFSPKGDVLAYSDYRRGIQLLETATGKLVQTIPTWFNLLAFSPDGKLLATTDRDGVIPIWDVATGKSVRELSGHGAPVVSLVFSSSGELLASGSRDHTTLIWDVKEPRTK